MEWEFLHGALRLVWPMAEEFVSIWALYIVGHALGKLLVSTKRKLPHWRNFENSPSGKYWVLILTTEPVLSHHCQLYEHAVFYLTLNRVGNILNLTIKMKKLRHEELPLICKRPQEVELGSKPELLLATVPCCFIIENFIIGQAEWIGGGKHRGWVLIFFRVEWFWPMNHNQFLISASYRKKLKNSQNEAKLWPHGSWH